MFLIAEASSRRTAARSVFLGKVTEAVPDPFLDTDEVPVFPESPDMTPSILDVTSASTISGDAPGYDHVTLMVLPESEGLY